MKSSTPFAFQPPHFNWILSFRFQTFEESVNFCHSMDLFLLLLIELKLIDNFSYTINGSELKIGFLLIWLWWRWMWLKNRNVYCMRIEVTNTDECRWTILIRTDSHSYYYINRVALLPSREKGMGQVFERTNLWSLQKQRFPIKNDILKENFPKNHGCLHLSIANHF